MSGTIQTHPATDAYRNGWDATFGEGPVLETMCAPDEPLVKVTEFVGAADCDDNGTSFFWVTADGPEGRRWYYADDVSPNGAMEGVHRFRVTVEMWPKSKDT